MVNAELAYKRALQKLINELNIDVDNAVLSEAMPHIEQMKSVMTLCDVMSNLNYSAHVLEDKLKEIDKRLFPLLITSDQGLFVCQHDGIIYDCNTAKQLDESKLPANYKVFFFKPLTVMEAKPENVTKILFHKYSKYYWQCWLLSFFINLLMLATPIFIIGVYNQVVGNFSPELLVSYTVGMAIALIGFVLLYLLRSQILAQTSAYIDSHLGLSTLKHILNLPARLVELSSKTSQINRIRDFNMMREFLVSQPLLFCFDLPFTIIFLIAIAFLAGWIVIFPVLAILFFAFLVAYRWFFPGMDLTDPQLAGEQQQRQMELLVNLTAIKSTNLTSHFYERYRDLTAEKTVNTTHNNIAINKRTALSNVIVFSATLLTVCFAVLKVMNAQASPAIVIVLVILSWRVLAPYKGFYIYVDLFKYVVKSFRELNQVFKIPEEYADQKETIPNKKLRGKLKFEHVSFRYPNSEQAVLNDITFAVSPGQIIVLTGDSGCGKTTLLKLLLQLYQPVFGSIYLDNNRLEQYPKNWFRHKVAYLPQDLSFIYGTLAQNIRVSNPRASEQALWHVCEMAGIAWKIRKMPEGLNTRIRDQELIKYGSAFLQGLALARVYLKNSKLLLLDDPVCYLDNQQVTAFSRYLLSMRGQATTILTTHRPSIMRLADKLIVLEKGNLVAQGNPKQILPKLIKSR